WSGRRWTKFCRRSLSRTPAKRGPTPRSSDLAGSFQPKVSCDPTAASAAPEASPPALETARRPLPAASATGAIDASLGRVPCLPAAGDRLQTPPESWSTLVSWASALGDGGLAPHTAHSGRDACCGREWAFHRIAKSLMIEVCTWCG